MSKTITLKEYRGRLRAFFIAKAALQAAALASLAVWCFATTFHGLDGEGYDLFGIIKNSIEAAKNGLYAAPELGEDDQFMTVTLVAVSAVPALIVALKAFFAVKTLIASVLAASDESTLDAIARDGKLTAYRAIGRRESRYVRLRKVKGSTLYFVALSVVTFVFTTSLGVFLATAPEENLVAFGLGGLVELIDGDSIVTDFLGFSALVIFANFAAFVTVKIFKFRTRSAILSDDESGTTIEEIENDFLTK